MNSYEESLLAYIEPEEAEDEDFRITDDGTAAWAIEKIKKHQDDLAQLNAVAESRHKQIDNWVRQQSLKIESSITYLTELLRPYAMQRLEGKKTRTHKVYNGTLSFRKGSVSYERDDAKLLAFVKASASDYIVTTEKVNWGEYKKTLKPVGDGRLVTADGELVEGVTYTQSDDVFTVKPLAMEAEDGKGNI